MASGFLCLLVIQQQYHKVVQAPHKVCTHGKVTDETLASAASEMAS
jgi:hypothetical protein